MVEVAVYNQEGLKTGEAKLSSLFEAKLNRDVVQQAVVAQNANARRLIAHTKTRGEVSGGGRKPWAQKGTGRARHGSIRSPLWKGGGVTFGPRSDRVYKQKVNKKVKKLALLQLLSEKARHNFIVLIDSFSMEKPKTKVMEQLLSKLPLGSAKTLLVLAKNEKAVVAASRNIRRVQVTMAQDLNALDVVSAKFVVFEKDALPVLEKMFAK
ncbi:MAG: 50S ribosomal protein L4 [bacterium]|nr:50S ribosomal protein L4 [bacterium]